MLQLVQSLHAWSVYSTRVFLGRTTCAADDAACAVPECRGPLLDPGSPGRHELSRRCCSMCSVRTPRALTRPGFPGRHELCGRCCSLCSNDSTHDIPGSTVLKLVAGPSTLEDVSPKVASACAALKRRLVTYKLMRSYSSVWQ